MGAFNLPLIISVDDHVVEPSHVWTEFLPEKYKDRAPHVVRRRERPPVPGPAGNGGITGWMGDKNPIRLIEDPEAPWVDSWIYDDLVMPFSIYGQAAAKDDRDRRTLRHLVTYDDIRPGCYQKTARLSDMDINHTEVSLSFPTFPRFCGQTFLEREDKDFALLCVQAYNDWMIDDWSAGEAYGRLIPLTLIPLWDPELAAKEVRRCAEKGSHAIAFSENPPALGLPSVHSRDWDPLFRACDETNTVVNMHVGSSSQMLTTGPTSPLSVMNALTFSGCMFAVIDWITSGTLARFPNIKIALSEGQVGWIPFILGRLDYGWRWGAENAGHTEETITRLPELPSSYFKGRVYGCVFDDLFGMKARDEVGMDQIMFETDYPHGDSTWPNSLKVAEEHIIGAGLDENEAWKFLRGNAIECYGLERYGITK